MVNVAVTADAAVEIEMCARGLSLSPSLSGVVGVVNSLSLSLSLSLSRPGWPVQRSPLVTASQTTPRVEYHTFKIHTIVPLDCCVWLVFAERVFTVLAPLRAAGKQLIQS